MYNKDSIGGLNSTASYLFNIPSKLTTSYRFLNTAANARCNISAHYDISNTMFEGLYRPYQIMFATDPPRPAIANVRISV